MIVQWIGLVLMAATINEVVLLENKVPGTNKYTVEISSLKIVELREAPPVPVFPEPFESIQYIRIGVVGETMDREVGNRKTYIKKGTLIYNKRVKSYDGPAYYINFRVIDETFQNKYTKSKENPNPIYIKWDKTKDGDDKLIQIKSKKKDKGLGLSELFYFNWNLMAISRYTNIIYYFDPISGNLDEWITIDDGTGINHQFEWATPKRGVHTSEDLYVGSNGIKDFQDVFVVQKNGTYVKWNWTKNYENLKSAGKIIDEGYMTHSACTWSYSLKKFFMVPSGAANEQYNLGYSRRVNTNMFLSIDEFSNSSELKTIGDGIEDGKSYYSIKFLPSSGEKYIVALQNSEKSIGEFESFIQVFNNDGKIIYSSTLIDTNQKKIRYSEFEFLFFDPIVSHEPNEPDA